MSANPTMAMMRIKRMPLAEPALHNTNSAYNAINMATRKALRLWLRMSAAMMSAPPTMLRKGLLLCATEYTQLNAQGPITKPRCSASAPRVSGLLRMYGASTYEAAANTALVSLMWAEANRYMPHALATKANLHTSAVAVMRGNPAA